MRFVLRRHTDAADAGVDAIGKRKIDNAKFAAKRHGRLGAPIGQRTEPAAAPTGENHREGVLRQQADVATGCLFGWFV